jgi:uncharacterized membrane protein YdjX (TVP38/TMEM64 family)
VLVLIYFYFGWNQYLTLDFIKLHQLELIDYSEAHSIEAIAIYFLIYVLLAAFSFPGASILSLLAGPLFGLLVGTVVVSLAATLGAVGAFLFARLLVRDQLNQKYGTQLKTFNEGIQKDGSFYLFLLRLNPLVPFFLINILAGLTSMELMTYFWVSFVGMIPGTVLYVNAGEQVGQIQNLADLISPAILLSLVSLGLFPLIIKWIFMKIKAKAIR